MKVQSLQPLHAQGEHQPLELSKALPIMQRTSTASRSSASRGSTAKTRRSDPFDTDSRLCLRKKTPTLSALRYHRTGFQNLAWNNLILAPSARRDAYCSRIVRKKMGPDQDLPRLKIDAKSGWFPVEVLSKEAGCIRAHSTSQPKCLERRPEASCPGGACGQMLAYKVNQGTALQG